MKNLARETMRKHADSEDTYTLRRVRLLLEFVEQLEKSMYNASDGTAAALLAPSKVHNVNLVTNCGNESLVDLYLGFCSLLGRFSTRIEAHVLNGWLEFV